MDGGDPERRVMKGCGRVSGELELIPQHFAWWQIDGQSRTTATTEGIFFHSRWQRRSRSRLRGLNQPLTMSLCETSFSHMVLFSAPHLSVLPPPRRKPNDFTADSASFYAKWGGGGSEVISTSCTLDWLVLEQPDDSPMGKGGGESSYGLPLHINRGPECNSAGNTHRTPTWRRGSWNFQLAGRREDRYASQKQWLSLQSRQLI